MNAREKRERSEAVKRQCFSPEIAFAYHLATMIRRGNESAEAAGAQLGGLQSARLFRLVADALEDATQFQPTPTCLNIVDAWYEGYWRQIRLPSGEVVVITSSGPTYREWKLAFIKLFVPEKERPRDCSRKALDDFRHRLLPSRQAVEKTLKQRNLPLRQDTVGRPRKAQPN